MKNKIKIAVLFVLLFGSAFVLTRKSELQAVKPKPDAAQTQTVTAGQKFKNIKVLNEMPADQMGKVMNIFSASLGVKCDYCHVENDFAKDGKEEKDTAREMIRMNLALNKDYFNNRPEISCNTCHQGHTHPQTAINFDAPAPEPRPKQPDVKPNIDQILDKYTAAVGGKDAIAKITSRMIKASRIEPNGKDSEPEEIWQKGEKLSIATTYSSKENGNYVVGENYDGTRAWKTGNQKEIPLKADETEQIKRDAQIFAFADLKTVYPKLDFRFVDKINGKEVYLVIGTLADNSRERLYFDANTNFLVRRVASTPTILGNFQYQVDYSDYKDFGGVKIPTTVRYAVPNIIFTRKITDVKINAPIDDAQFAK